MMNEFFKMPQSDYEETVKRIHRVSKFEKVAFVVLFSGIVALFLSIAYAAVNN